MKRRSLYAVVAVLLFHSGCASQPRLPDNSRVDIAEVVDRVQCELFEAYDHYTRRHRRKKEFEWLKEMAVAYSLLLSVDVTGGVSVSSDFLGLAPGFTLGTGLGVKGVTSRTAKLSFSLYLNDLRKPPACPDPNASKTLYFSDNTGMREWLDRVLESFTAEDQLYKQRPTTFSHQLEFVVSVDGSLGPSWVLQHARPKVGLSGTLKDTHSLTVAFAKPKREDAAFAADGKRQIDSDTQFRLNQELYNLELQRSFRLQLQ